MFLSTTTQNHYIIIKKVGSKNQGQKLEMNGTHELIICEFRPKTHGRVPDRTGCTCKRTPCRWEPLCLWVLSAPCFPVRPGQSPAAVLKGGHDQCQSVKQPMQGKTICLHVLTSAYWFYPIAESIDVNLADFYFLFPGGMKINKRTVTSK